MRHAVIILLLTFGAAGTTFAAQKLDVTIIDRHESESSYSYVVPGRTTTNSNSSADCSEAVNRANCSATTTSTTSATPSLVGTYTVSGSTLSLRLPDGRIVVVNCDSKPNHTEWTGRAVRNCRVPQGDKINAEFDGDKAKLVWPVGIDGKKTQSETYKIIAILEKP